VRPQADPEEGYYSYDLGSWHVVALNSNCEEVRCGPGSSQTRWLEEDLAANDEARCTLAYMHHPRFSSGEEHGSTANHLITRPVFPSTRTRLFPLPLGPEKLPAISTLSP
jgi:hypothetical protein